jgi:hypothetical protein
LNATADVSFRRESFVSTISSGMPGFTSAALRYSVPRSMPRTADTADAVEEKRRRIQRSHENVETLRRPRAAIVEDVDVRKSFQK